MQENDNETGSTENAEDEAAGVIRDPDEKLRDLARDLTAVVERYPWLALLATVTLGYALGRRSGK